MNDRASFLEQEMLSHNILEGKSLISHTFLQQSCLYVVISQYAKAVPNAKNDNDRYGTGIGHTFVEANIKSLMESYERHISGKLYIEKECPKWLYDKIRNPALVEALNGTAGADIRTNLTAREDVKDKLQKEGLFFSFTPYSPYGLRSADRINLQNCIAYQNGEIEVQDESSQLGAVLCDVRENQRIIDYCCGAGGKSLLLGAILKNKGTIYAHDINTKRLKILPERAKRLGITNIKIKDNLTPQDEFDRFIIDAPCSGSGTWRRSPDAKYRLTPKQLETIKKTQAEILDIAAGHLSSEGRIVYMTCSVLPEENEQQIERFLQRHPDYEIVNMKDLWERKLEKIYPSINENYLHCSPLLTGTDGFFVCVLQKK